MPYSTCDIQNLIYHCSEFVTNQFFCSNQTIIEDVVTNVVSSILSERFGEWCEENKFTNAVKERVILAYLVYGFNIILRRISITKN
jgi:hypothetical protein